MRNFYTQLVYFVTINYEFLFIRFIPLISFGVAVKDELRGPVLPVISCQARPSSGLFLDRQSFKRRET